MEMKTKYPGIYKLPEGYRIRAYGKDPKTGKMKEVDRVLQAVSIAEAVRVHAELRGEITSGGDRPAPQTTLSAYVRSWLERRSVQYKRSTLEGKVLALERHVLPHLGDIYLDKLTQSDIERWMLWFRNSSNVRNRRFRPATVNYAWRVLRTILKDAVVEFGLPRDPTLRVRSLPATPREENDPNALLAAEIPRFLEAIQSRFPQHYAFVFVGLTTGMRFGELSALTWDDIDEQDGVIRVVRAQYRGVVGTTKTGTRRTVPLTQAMAHVLRDHRRGLVSKQNPGLARGLVFPSEQGGYRFPSHLQKPFVAACVAAGIRCRFTPQGMRRTFNTLMLRAGVDHVVLRATIGHSSEAMTEHYAFVSMDAKREGVERMMGLLSIKNSQDA